MLYTPLGVAAEPLVHIQVSHQTSDLFVKSWVEVLHHVNNLMHAVCKHQRLIRPRTLAGLWHASYVDCAGRLVGVKSRITTQCCAFATFKEDDVSGAKFLQSRRSFCFGLCLLVFLDSSGRSEIAFTIYLRLCFAAVLLEHLVGSLTSGLQNTVAFTINHVPNFDTFSCLFVYGFKQLKSPCVLLKIHVDLFSFCN